MKNMTMADLKALPSHEVMACVRCAGHRRQDIMALAPNLIRGVNYGPFAMYNAVYKGARIKDVLEFAGIKTEGLESKWLTSTGADEDFPGDPV